MNVSVGFACLVAVALMEGVTGQIQLPQQQPLHISNLQPQRPFQPQQHQRIQPNSVAVALLGGMTGEAEPQAFGQDMGEEIRPNDIPISEINAEHTDSSQCHGCECDYHLVPAGCKIVVAAPDNWACKCTDRCSECVGQIVGCRFPNSSECKKPTKSLSSCRNGGGNCNGY